MSARGATPHWYIPVLLVTAVIAVFVVRVALVPAKLSPAAANFSLARLLDQTETVSLSDYRGQPVILNFFASWCAPCRREIPALELLYQRHAEQGLVVIGVGSMDGKRPLIGFVSSTGVSFPVVWDKLGQVTAEYGVHSLPSTQFIDRQGKIRVSTRGGLDAAQMEAWAKTIID